MREELKWLAARLKKRFVALKPWIKEIRRHSGFHLLVLAVLVLNVYWGAWQLWGATESDRRDAAADPERNKRHEPLPAPTSDVAQDDWIGNPTLSKKIGDMAMQTRNQRLEAMAEFERSGTEADRAWLREEVQTNATGMQGRASCLLVQVGSKKDRELVAEAFLEKPKDSSPLLAVAAAELSDAKVANELVALHRSRKILVREAVARALRDTPEVEMHALLRLVVDPVARVRESARRTAASLDRRRQKEFREALRTTLISDRMMRVAAVHLCGLLRAEWSLHVVADLSLNGEPAVRAEAIRTLGSLQGRRVSRALADIVYRANSRLEQRQAVEAMGRQPIDPWIVRELLRVGRETEDPALTLAVARSLVRQRNRDGIALLVDLYAGKRGNFVAQRQSRTIMLAAGDALQRISARMPRNPKEPWAEWWQRAQQQFRFPSRIDLPPLPTLS